MAYKYNFALIVLLSDFLVKKAQLWPEVRSQHKAISHTQVHFFTNKRTLFPSFYKSILIHWDTFAHEVGEFIQIWLDFSILDAFFCCTSDPVLFWIAEWIFLRFCRTRRNSINWASSPTFSSRSLWQEKMRIIGTSPSFKEGEKYYKLNFVSHLMDQKVSFTLRFWLLCSTVTVYYNYCVIDSTPHRYFKDHFISIM